MADPCVRLSDELRNFVDLQKWIFAKTFAATWPHEYIVRARVDETLFVALVRHIRAHGYQGHFYRRTIIYFGEGDHVYWTMGDPLDQTEIINRCLHDQTYAYRLARNLLPERLRPATSAAPTAGDHLDSSSAI